MKLRVRSQSGTGPTIWRADLRLRSLPAAGLLLCVVGAGMVGTVQETRSAGLASPTSAVVVTLTPNLRSGQPVGTSIIWHAAVPGLGTPVYQFSVTPPGGPARMVRDFSAGSFFTWTPMQEGTFTISVSAKSGF